MGRNAIARAAAAGMTVTHIVPLFAPQIDGVGDYALNLARSLRQLRGIDSRFVVCSPAWSGPAEIENFQIAGPTQFKTDPLLEAIRDAKAMILHYVGYGYHRKGVPSWLIRTVQQWRRATAGARLITIFHEIWSAGPPWRTVFFLGPIQRQLVSQLLNFSAHSFISTRWSLDLLNAILPNSATLLPVSATIQPCSKSSSRGRMGPPWRPLIFGQSWTRLPAIEKHARLLEHLHKTNQLDRVLLMGKEIQADPLSEEITAICKILPEDKIDVIGERLPAEAAEQFNRADFILASHHARDICKSSVLMSAFACECPAILPNRRDAAPLEPDTHFLSCTGSELDIKELENKISAGVLPNIARNAHAWFKENADWPIVTSKIADRLK